MIFEIISSVSIFMALWIGTGIIYYNNKKYQLLNIDRDNKIMLLKIINERLNLLKDDAPDHLHLINLKNKLIDELK